MAAATAPKSLTLRELAMNIAERSDASEADVKAMLHALADITAGELEAGYPVIVPGVCKLSLKYVSAKPRRKVTNPRTGEERMAKASPARLRLVARPAMQLRPSVPSMRTAAGKQVEKVAQAKARDAAKRARAREVVVFHA